LSSQFFLIPLFFIINVISSFLQLEHRSERKEGYASKTLNADWKLKQKKGRKKNLPKTKKTNLNFLRKKIIAHLESCKNLSKNFFSSFFFH
jgi:hypothetical protein